MMSNGHITSLSLKIIECSLLVFLLISVVSAFETLNALPLNND